MSKIPVVAIVGRANVGKSSIFNRFVGHREAIVADVPGTTRDNVTAVIEAENTQFRLIDTAGLKRPEDDFEVTIQDQINEATEAADVILVAVESHLDVTEEDRQVAKLALKSKKPVALLMNKVDKARKQSIDHWEKTGIRDRFATSAIHGTGFSEVEEFIEQNIPAVSDHEAKDGKLRVALIGRPNVGKSRLFNALGRKQQAIVADVAGTTRDINRMTVSYHGQQIEFLDTAGVRKSGKIERGIEKFSVIRTMQAIDEADICIVVMDVNELNVRLDQKLAGIIADNNKGLILAVSKWDSIEKDSYTHDQIARQISGHFQHVRWAPLIFTSAVSGQNVTNIFELIQTVTSHRQQSLETKELNLLLNQVVSHHPPPGYKTHPKLKYATQTGKNPPEITVFGRNTKDLHWSYKRFIENALRQNWDLEGTPIKIFFREGKDRHK